MRASHPARRRCHERGARRLDPTRRGRDQVDEALWLGVVFGVGAALSIGPVFVTIVQEAAARGFGASARVILGSATADLVLVGPALAASWLIAGVESAALYLAIVGAAYFVYLAFEALRDSRRLWLGGGIPASTGGWAFGKGVLGNLLNPLAWSFWLATGTPTMLRAREAAGWEGLFVFTVVWFVVAMAVEGVIAFAVARTGATLGGRAMAGLSAVSAGLFVLLAILLLSS